MALLPRHVVALCGQASRGEGGKVHSLFWWKKCVETLNRSFRRMVTNKINYIFFYGGKHSSAQIFRPHPHTDVFFLFQNVFLYIVLWKDGKVKQIM